MPDRDARNDMTLEQDRRWRLELNQRSCACESRLAAIEQLISRVTSIDEPDRQSAVKGRNGQYR
jgi:hypothetical protein